MSKLGRSLTRNPILVSFIVLPWHIGITADLWTYQSADKFLSDDWSMWQGSADTDTGRRGNNSYIYRYEGRLSRYIFRYVERGPHNQGEHIIFSDSAKLLQKSAFFYRSLLQKSAFFLPKSITEICWKSTGIRKYSLVLFVLFQLS